MRISASSMEMRWVCVCVIQKSHFSFINMEIRVVHHLKLWSLKIEGFGGGGGLVVLTTYTHKILILRHHRRLKSPAQPATVPPLTTRLPTHLSHVHVSAACCQNQHRSVFSVRASTSGDQWIKSIFISNLPATLPAALLVLQLNILLIWDDAK